MPIYENTEMTPKEHLLLEAQKDESRLAREHAVTMKQLELALAQDKYTAEIELRRLEAKWGSWLKLPATVIKLPVYILLGIGYIVYAIRNTDPPKNFWSFIK